MKSQFSCFPNWNKPKCQKLNTFTPNPNRWYFYTAQISCSATLHLSHQVMFLSKQQTAHRSCFLLPSHRLTRFSQLSSNISMPFKFSYVNRSFLGYMCFLALFCFVLEMTCFYIPRGCFLAAQINMLHGLCNSPTLHSPHHRCPRFITPFSLLLWFTVLTLCNQGKKWIIHVVPEENCYTLLQGGVFILQNPNQSLCTEHELYQHWYRKQKVCGICKSTIKRSVCHF